MDQIITGGLIAMGGAVASHTTGVLTLVNSGRRHKQEAATRRAIELEAKRRALYQELLITVDDARAYCAEVPDARSRRDPEGLPERFGPLRTVAIAVMIDGSARASETAATIASALRELTQTWKAAAKMATAEGLDLVALRLSELAVVLGKAERELIAAARADLGVPD